MDEQTLKSSVIRGLNELGFARLYRIAQQSLHAAETNHSMDFFRIADIAMSNDKIAKLVLVLDRDCRSATFWGCYEKLRTACPLTASDLAFLDGIATRIIRVRNKTLFHIDCRAVTDPKSVWRDAGITLIEFDKACKVLWDWYVCAHRYLTGTSFVAPEYDGSDIGPILRLAEEGGFLK